MAQIGVMRLLLVRRMQVRAEHLQHFFRPLPKPNRGARNALAHEPVAAVERGGPTVERIAVHGACGDGEGGQDDEPGAEDAAMVELGVGEDVARGGPDGEVVGVGPAFLQGDDVGYGLRAGDLVPDAGEARGAGGRDVFEAPAVEGEEVEFLWGDGGRGGVGHGVVVR